MNQKMIIPCVRGVQGDWVFYSGNMNTRQMLDWVEIREDNKISQKTTQILSKYLINNEQHFFNSLLIGVYDGMPEWIEFDFDKAEVKNNSQIGLVAFNGNEKMFVIDGQCRVSGIIEAFRIDNEKPVVERNVSNDVFPVIFLAHIDDEQGRKRTKRLSSDINKKVS